VDVFGRDQALTGLFMPPETFDRIIESLERRRNVILEGPPGVGKTFVARRVAWTLMGQRDDSRVLMVQFHQSYAYEDFIQGWRPAASGGFELRNGVFYEFCQRAAQDPDRPYVFIIDEINRGNLSRILGEAMLLIEADKRGPGWSVPLTYARSLDDRFYVPDNIFLLGLMNTADRSLALVDYALRRRFAFVKLEPGFGTEAFAAFFDDLGEPELAARIIERMTALNERIRDDRRNLGPGFEIGHSFFVPEGNEVSFDWYERVIRSEIEPLLREYWFDSQDKVEAAVSELLRP
jgi:5-methylcytosine-specific restriction protein B